MNKYIFDIYIELMYINRTNVKILNNKAWRINNPVQIFSYNLYRF